MGVLIQSEDEKFNVWESGSPQYGEFLNQLGWIILNKYKVKPARLIYIENDYEESTIGLTKYPELKGMITEHMNKLQTEIKKYDLYKKIYFNMPTELSPDDDLESIAGHCHYKNKDITKNVIDAINILYLKTSYEENAWNSYECKTLYTFLMFLEGEIDNYILPKSSPFTEIIKFRISNLLKGLKYCYENNQKAIFH
ncbi:MAG: hypothetical protein Edafosvirus6_14 [Edafosvirus sp.]|uniref:Uncharacterized protein n=1 Tax=Edafosvirus sp. TaxID=2487765 RepID=A0A3G4ZTE5_9VIRU|nr:MAG: hypothetical protein Edafosvirus6_14 [Edafosvirus sp.]